MCVICKEEESFKYKLVFSGINLVYFFYEDFNCVCLVWVVY